MLENGLWHLRVSVTDTGGYTGFADVGLIVDGRMKLGSYDLAFVDSEWSTALYQTTLRRSYSTLRKDIVGDFGNGWQLEILDMTVATNGPLGDGGWSQEQCGDGLIFAPVLP